MCGLSYSRLFKDSSLVSGKVYPLLIYLFILIAVPDLIYAPIKIRELCSSPLLMNCLYHYGNQFSLPMINQIFFSTTILNWCPENLPPSGLILGISNLEIIISETQGWSQCVAKPRISPLSATGTFFLSAESR